MFLLFKTKKQENLNQLPFDNIPPQFRDFFKNFPLDFLRPPQQQRPNNQPENETPQALGSGFVRSPVILLPIITLLSKQMRSR